jgi:hypothetical protein
LGSGKPFTHLLNLRRLLFEHGFEGIDLVLLRIFGCLLLSDRRFEFLFLWACGSGGGKEPSDEESSA